MEDRHLIERCLQKDKSAWDEFIQRYSKPIYSYIYTVLREKNISYQSFPIEDLFQDIFFHLIKDRFKRLAQFKGRSSFLSWLKVVVINFTLDYLRKRQIPYVSLDEELSGDEEFTLKDILKDENVSLQEEQVIDREDIENLSDCIESLSNQERFFIEMHIYRGLDLERIRKVLKLSRSAVDMRKQRLIQKLRNCFQRKGFLLEV